MFFVLPDMESILRRDEHFGSVFSKAIEALQAQNSAHIDMMIRHFEARLHDKDEHTATKIALARMEIRQANLRTQLATVQKTLADYLRQRTISAADLAAGDGSPTSALGANDVADQLVASVDPLVVTVDPMAA